MLLKRDSVGSSGAFSPRFHCSVTLGGTLGQLRDLRAQNMSYTRAVKDLRACVQQICFLAVPTIVNFPRALIVARLQTNPSIILLHFFVVNTSLFNLEKG